jgi:hypothetical protein
MTTRRRRLAKLAPVLLLAFALTGCEAMYALEHDLEQGAAQHPGGPIAFGSDLLAAGAMPVQAIRRR